MEPDIYLTIKSFSQSVYKEKGSRFIGLVYPVTSEEEIKKILKNIHKEHHSAKHFCFAWMLGPERVRYRSGDDGEPSGTAGRQILGQINSASLTDILIVVVRYFGGKLLGASGLANAYRTAAAGAIETNSIVKKYVSDNLQLRFPYPALDKVMKVLKEWSIIQTDQVIGLNCSMKISFRRVEREKIINSLSATDGMVITRITDTL